MGGHRLWVARPGADEAEETYAADNQPCKVVTSADGFTITGALDPVQKIRRGFTVIATADGRITLDHFVRNESDMLWSGGLWALTCTVPPKDASYVVPLGDGSSWDYAMIVSFRIWGGDHGGMGFDDPQFGFTKDAMVLHPSGRENKRMLKADAGIMALRMIRRRSCFSQNTRSTNPMEIIRSAPTSRFMSARRASWSRWRRWARRRRSSPTRLLSTARPGCWPRLKPRRPPIACANCLSCRHP